MPETAYDDLPEAPAFRSAPAISEPTAPAGSSPYDDLPDATSPYDDTPDSQETIAQRIDADPYYSPTREEFRAYRDFHKSQPSRPWEAAKAGAKGIGKAFVDLGKGLMTGTGERRSMGDWLQTIGESMWRGTTDLGSLARVGLDKLASIYDDQDESVFLAIKADQLNRQAFPGGRTPATEWFVPGQNVPKQLMDQWKKEFGEYKLDRDFQRFQVNRGIGRMREDAKRGRDNIVPEVAGEPLPAITEPLATFTDASDIATFGGGMAAEALLRGLTRSAVETGTSAAGKAATATGKGITAAANIPEQLAKAGTRALGATEDAAKLAGKTVEAATTVTGAKALGKTVTSAGEAASAVGRAVAGGPTRLGALERISKDGAAPSWLRKAAIAAAPLDPALDAITGAAGAAGRGAAGGAMVGAGLGFVLSGGELDAAASGAGSGTVLGTAGGLANRVRTRAARANAEADADLARWLGGKSTEEIANIGSLRLSRDQALKVADVERWARGVMNENGGDVSIRYLTDADFSKQFGGSAKGAEIIHGERPTVFINTGYRGPRSLFHEVFHAIDDLDAFDPQRAALNERLFTETAPDGTVLRRGAFDPTDLAAFEQQYVSRLGDQARTEWGQMTPQDRATRIRKEIRAESFASMVSGASGREILTGASGWRRRLADSMLLADHASTLGRMRRFLEHAGVEFKGSGDPSEIFFKDGRALTNQPEVDAALRDYMRAKRRVTERLVAGDDTAPEVVFDHHAMMANPRMARKLAEQYPDWDGWERKPDGTVKYLGDRPVLATEKEIQRVQARRVEGMLAALESVPDDGTPGAVRKQDNGHWTGQRFTDAQVRALQAVPDDVLSPLLKGKIVLLNSLAAEPGRQIVLDYNAALKGRRYSSGISPTTRIAVPITLDISKAGNFVMTTLDVTHFMRKLGDWQKGKPRAFDAWGGDVDGFLRDVMKYLDNHQRGLPGATDLDPDARTAIVKRNTIKDLFNVGGPGVLSETGGAPISGKTEKDNLIRSRRFDRINRITPGEGTPFPIDYYKQKANYLPPDAAKITIGSDLPSLPKAEKQRLLKSLGDRYREAKVQKEFKGMDSRGEERYGYAYTPDEFVVSDKSGRRVRYYVTLDDGTKVHPDELYRTSLGENHWERVAASEAARIERQAKDNAARVAQLSQWAIDAGADKSKANNIFSAVRGGRIPGSAFWSDPSGNVIRISMGGDDPKLLLSAGWKQISDMVPTLDTPKFLPPTNPAEVVQVTRDQAVSDFARTLGLSINTGRALGEAAWQHLERTQPRKPLATENAMQLSAILGTLNDPQAITRAAESGGLEAARAEVIRQLQLAKLNQ